MACNDCNHTREHDREITRRKLLDLAGRGLALGAFGLSLGSLGFMREAYGLQPENPLYKGFLCVSFEGGASHIDTLDPKPGSRNNVFNTITLGNDVYNNPIRISEVFPTLANLSQNDPAIGVGIIRSMWHGSNNHNVGQLAMSSFWRGQLQNSYPSMAPVFAHYFQGQGIGIPSVVVTGGVLNGINDARGARVPTALAVAPGQGQGQNPVVQALSLPPGVDADRYRRRKALLDRFNIEFLNKRPDDVVKAWKKASDDAADITIKGEAARAFDLTGKPLLPAAGNGEAQRFTLAQELLKAGVPYVTCGIGGNDSHGNNMGTVRRNWGQTFDRAIGQMALNLKATGQPYLICTISDFGRSPATVANGRDGRDHWGGSFSVMLISINQPQFKKTAIGDTGPDGLFVAPGTANGSEGGGAVNGALVDPFEPAHLGYLVYKAMGIPLFAADGRADVPTALGRDAPPVDRMASLAIPTGNTVRYGAGLGYGPKLAQAFGLG